MQAAEWVDATRFQGVAGWMAQFTPVTDSHDLQLTGFVKHDMSHLYFGFNVTDDYLYGRDTPRWLPPGFPLANSLTRQGFPLRWRS